MKNGKKSYYCNAYREHSSSFGSSVSAQKEYLSIFLAQWEDAVNHNAVCEQNEVHISLDMNLDHSPNCWLQSSYRLCSLTRLVENTCDTNNFTQLVKQATRFMYNSVANKTEMSCIDHIYTNAKHKCTLASVLSTGTSDHKLVGFTRYSKDPPVPAQIVQKRSYKDFDEEAFMRDLAVVDWSEVYAMRDLDDAVGSFTAKFNAVLDLHAPCRRGSTSRHGYPLKCLS